MPFRGNGTSRARGAFIALVLIPLVTGNASAQDVRARLQGLVSDTSGGVLPGVTVVLTNDGTGVAATRTTNADGRYLFDFVESGTYSVSAEFAGSKTTLQRGVHGFAFSGDCTASRMGVQWSFYDGTDADQARVRRENGTLVLAARGTTPKDSAPLWFVTGDHPYEIEVEVDIDPGATAGVLAFYNRRLYAGLGYSDKEFINAINEFQYRGTYRGVFPIKVNQLREVVEEILDAGRPFGFGLEVGSKPELLAGLALQRQEGDLIICNGYKDPSFIRMALMGKKLGRNVIMVDEKLEELRQIIAVSRQFGVEPNIGVRSRLLSKGAGKWAESAGENAKFGLSTVELMAATDLLRAENLGHCFRLLHFHIGSHVPDILTV